MSDDPTTGLPSTGVPSTGVPSTGVPPDDAEAAPELPVLSEPADGVPLLIDTPAGLSAAVEALRAGTGPVAVDAERAQGFRYSSRAYLIQLRRAGTGTLLIDPVAFAHDGAEADLSAVREVIADQEWIIHAASQDLPCLAEVRMIPTRLFDTELAARLLGDARVALGTLVENTFGVRLLKEHSAANWSSRPLPESWLTYAALDVELLIGLRDVLAERLREAGKDEWASEEFAALVADAGARPERDDPWRRTSGMHTVRSPLGLATVRELWQARDEIARRTDTGPGRIVADKAISELAAKAAKGPLGRDDLRRIPGFQRRTARRYEVNWVQALERVQAMHRRDYPPTHVAGDGPPPPRSWQHRDPAAFARLGRMREAVTARAEELELPQENLVSPDSIRRLAWAPPEPDEQQVDGFLAARGARTWQRRIVVPLVTPLIPDPAD